MIYLTKKVRFSASHTPAGRSPHGHNYVLEVTLRRGEGAVSDFRRLAEVLDETILKKVNYKHLDETEENLVVTFWKALEREFPKGTLYEIKLQRAESETVIYRGENG